VILRNSECSEYPCAKFLEVWYVLTVAVIHPLAGLLMGNSSCPMPILSWRNPQVPGTYSNDKTIMSENMECKKNMSLKIPQQETG